ncbi:MAG TPA: zinc metalloprotease, partial [Bacteroidia bacterium]
MKKIITGMLFASCLTVVNFAHAQNVAPQNSGATYFHRCGEAEYEDFLRSKDPLYDIKKQDAENLIAKKVKEIEDAKKAGHPLPNTTYTIPVVFHVVYNTANATAENISDQQVQYAFAQLNQDWSRTNTDAGNTPAVWQSIAVNMGIQYCLATKDPNGATTTGIVHKATSSTSFTTDDKVKSSAQGGDDPWDVTKYLNIWICNLGSSLLGYGAFPTSPIPSTWGTVVHYISIGSLTHPNSAGGTFGYGRTLSHEIGHCFNLYHIWGDDAGACTGSDAVSDTPNMADATSGCPTGVVTDACGAGTDGSPASSSAPGRMYQNYMDYTDDMCYNMFTAGQKTKAQSAIATWLMTVANNASTACNTTVYALDAGVNAIVSPGGISCNASITPVVTLENYGSSTLTTCKILYN